MGKCFSLRLRRHTETIRLKRSQFKRTRISTCPHKELLAQFRCDEISAVVLAEFSEQAKSQKRPLEGGRVVEGLGAMMNTSFE